MSDILIHVSITFRADSILYSALRSSTKSLVSFFAIYSAIEDISFSGSLFMRLLSKPLLTVTNPAFAALEYQSICLLVIRLTNIH